MSERPGEPPESSAAKRVPRATIAERVRRWEVEGIAVARAIGCFDLLDGFVLRALERGRGNAARLVVEVRGDREARAVLGPGRPLLAAEERARLVAALRGVDLVGVREESDPMPSPGTVLDVDAERVRAGEGAADPVVRIRARLGGR